MLSSQRKVDGVQDKHQVLLRVLRYHPEKGEKAYWADYKLDADRYDRVLDLLHAVKWHMDGSLTFRRSCGHGVCGSCAMRINGVNRLACKQLARSLGDVITVEPLPGYTVLKDLVVDMTPFFAAYRRIQPYLEPPLPLPMKEQIQLPAEHARYEEATRCILCSACTTACPLYRADAGQLGAAALVQAHRFVFDSRDGEQACAQRLALIDSRQGLWHCRTALRCTAVCPQGIQVSQALQELKQAVAKRNVRPRHS